MNSVIKIFPVMDVILLFFASSTTLHVNSDYDRSHTFSKCKTYALFASHSSKPALSELHKKRILSATEAETDKKDFTENTDHPDLPVNAVAVRKNEPCVSFTSHYYGYSSVSLPYAWSGTLGLSSATTYQYDTYQDASLIIDNVDESTKKKVWFVRGKSKIDQPLKKRDRKIPAFISEIIASFPPGLQTINYPDKYFII